MEVNQTVDSKALKKINYKNGNLIITFRSGGKFLYRDVPEEVLKEFLEAESAGSFYNNHIRGVYEEEKL